VHRTFSYIVSWINHCCHSIWLIGLWFFCCTCSFRCLCSALWTSQYVWVNYQYIIRLFMKLKSHITDSLEVAGVGAFNSVERVSHDAEFITWCRLHLITELSYHSIPRVVNLIYTSSKTYTISYHCNVHYFKWPIVLTGSVNLCWTVWVLMQLIPSLFKLEIQRYRLRVFPITATVKIGIVHYFWVRSTITFLWKFLFS